MTIREWFTRLCRGSLLTSHKSLIAVMLPSAPGGAVMHRSFVALMFLLLGSALLAQSPSPDDLAKHAIGVQAGKAWDKTRYFAFTFDVDRGDKRVASFAQ